MFGCLNTLIVLIIFTNVFIQPASTKNGWQKPGCHRMGHNRKISIPGCVEFSITTNACRGYCESWSIPSGPKSNPDQPVTSVGECCNMMDTEDVEAEVLCIDGVKRLTFKSAKSCECYHCKKI